MYFSTNLRLAALATLAVPAVAQNITFLESLLQTFEGLNLTSLINATSTINGSATGQALLSQLGNGAQTIFAPNNDAWVGVHPNISSNPELLASVLSYHVLPGQFNTTPTFPNTTVGRTFLNASSGLVFLEGNKNQVLAWSNQSGTVRILNQNTAVSIVSTTTVNSTTINVVNAVIDTPGEFTAALAANNLTSFSTALQAAGLLDSINFQHGVTVFAPTDEAFTSLQANLSSVTSNTTLLQTILRNHVINGTSVYSGELIALGSSNETSAAGEGIGASFNSSGGFVTNGNVTARIVTPDIVLWNGVVHIVDQVFFNEESNEAAASSAVSSASSAATVSTTETGPIGFTPSPTSASGSSSSSSAAGSKVSLIGGPLNGLGAAGLFSVVSLVLGATLVL